MLRAAKDKLFGSRVVHFCTRIWWGRGDGYRFGYETWNDGNTAYSDGCKTPGSDGETSNNSSFYFSLCSILKKNRMILLLLYGKISLLFCFCKFSMKLGLAMSSPFPSYNLNSVEIFII